MKKLNLRLDLFPWESALLGIFSFFTRFFNLLSPAKVVFDETHFGLYATKYLSHQYYLDIHPPLGKMLLAIGGFLGKIQPGFNFGLNNSYSDFSPFSLRFLPALLGSLFVILIYFFVKEIGFSRRVAFLAAFLVLFDNALIAQSRLILLDIILLFFIFLSFYLFVLTKRFPPNSFKWYLFNVLTGLSLGITISIKWTGFGVLGIIWFITIFEEKALSGLKKENLTKIALFFILPFLIYFSAFALHFYLVPSPCAQNCGEFLDEVFKEYKISSFNTPPQGNFFAKFLEVHKLMLFLNFNSTMPHEYQSYWYSWPFMLRPIKYFWKLQGDKTSYIYFLGNPIVWWAAIIGVLGYVYLLIKNYLSKFKLGLPKSFFSPSTYFLILGYIFYTLPFATIERPMLIYHYLPALVFSIIIFSVFFEGVLEMIFGAGFENRLTFPSKKANFLFFGFLILVFVSFLFFSPLTYGFPLTEKAFQARMWFNIWSF